MTMHRYYTCLKRDSDFKKRVSWFDGLPEQLVNRKNIAVVEYIGKYNETIQPHGNSKVNEQAYTRTDPEVLNAVTEKVKYQKPSDVYTKMTEHDDSSIFPRDLKQCQNAKSRQITKLKETKKHNKSRKNVADEILNLIELIGENKFVAEITHSRNNKPPTIICYTEKQLEDIRSFITNHSGVVGIDRTFNLGQCFVTLTVYKSHKVVRKTNGEPPIFIGPLMLHWDGQFTSYYKFFTHLRGVLNLNLTQVELLLGTDDEKAMTNALDATFPEANRRLCTKHIKDNVTRQLTDKIPTNRKERAKIVKTIFGRDGIANANDSTTFDERSALLKEELKQYPGFLEYFEKYVQKKIADHCINQEDKLWTNNNTESMNNRLKVACDWKPLKCDELVFKLEEIINTQMVDLRRALYDKGNFSVNTRYAKYKLSHASWSAKSPEEKSDYFKKFLNARKNVQTARVTSSCGKFTIPRPQTLARKPHQRTRCKATKSTTRKR